MISGPYTVLEKQHVTAFVKSFVKAPLQDRYMGLLGNEKARTKVKERLNHKILDDLLEDALQAVHPASIDNSVPAYVVSDSPDIDRLVLPINEALKLMDSAAFGTIVSVLPGDLAIVKPEAPANAVWLYR